MKNKKISIILLISFIGVIIAVGILSTIMRKEDVEETKVIAPTTVEGLSPIVNINKDTNPILWDFVYGSLGYASDIKQTSIEDFFFIVALNKTTFDQNPIIYSSYYTWGEGLCYPALGTNPTNYTLNAQEKEVVEKTIPEMARVYEEGNWEFLIIQQNFIENVSNTYDCLDTSYRWCGINFIQFMNNDEPGLAYNDIITNKEGYPTEWCRKDEWIEPLKAVGIDITVDFWNDWNLWETKFYYPAGTTKDQREGIAPIEVYAKNIRRYIVNIDGEKMELNQNEFKIFISEYEEAE